MKRAKLCRRLMYLMFRSSLEQVQRPHLTIFSVFTHKIIGDQGNRYPLLVVVGEGNCPPLRVENPFSVKRGERVMQNTRDM